MRLRLVGPAALLLAVAGCGDGTGPDTRGYRIAATAGDGQYGEVGQFLPDPLEVTVTDGGEPVAGLAIRWEAAGSGASLTVSSATTDSAGVARARLRLGQDTGSYGVRASFAGLAGEPASFTARAILRPVVTGVSPAQAAAGDTVTIDGEHLGTDAAATVVLFDGFRGTVVEASGTRVRATVPRCVPTRTADVTVRIGAVESAPVALDVTGDDAPPIDLAVGEVLALADPDDLACVRLPGGQFDVAFLAVQQNASPLAGRKLPFQLVGVTGRAAPLLALSAPTPEIRALTIPGAGAGDLPTAWEARLRLRERTLSLHGAGRPLSEPTLRTASAPAPGTRTTFKVYNKDEKFTDVTAEVKYVSANAVIYQDVNAPAGGFTTADLAGFAALFDDPIFATDTATFGRPSDIDGNGRIVVLFTPVVNELTPRGSTGFIAGFFYGLDLTQEANSNRAEIFYSIVPDPDGRYGDARSRDEILRAVPPVLAHELQHMIHFNERNLVRGSPTQEALWLSEALAHMAEDLVGEALAARGDADAAQDFRLANYTRAYRYLEDPRAVSVIDVRAPGTLEERGAQWLVLKYLAGHFGETALLKALTQSTLTGVANVERVTGEAWDELFNRWAVALWADDAPELAGAPVDSVYTFPNIDLRRELGQFRDGFPLRPAASDFADFLVVDTLLVSSPFHLILEARQLNPEPLHLSFTRVRGDGFTVEDRPRWAILRIR